MMQAMEENRRPVSQGFRPVTADHQSWTLQADGDYFFISSSVY